MYKEVKYKFCKASQMVDQLPGMWFYIVFENHEHDCFRTKRKEITLSIQHQVTQTNIPPKEIVSYEKETQTATELADKEG